MSAAIDSEPALERGLSALVWDGIFSQALGVLTGGALLTGCALALGASPGFVGLLAAIPFFAQLAHIPAVILIETLRRRRLICIATTALARVMFIPLALLPIVPDVGIARLLLLAVFAIITPLGAIGGCAWISWTCDLVPRHRLGDIFARRQLRAHISGIVAGLIGGVIVDQWARFVPGWHAGGYVGVFSLGVAAAVGSTLCLMRMPDVPMPPPSPGNLRALFARPFADSNFRRLMGFLGCWNLAINLALPFFTVYLVQDLNAPISTAIALGIVTQLANIAALPLWGRISDRCSNKTLIAACAPAFLLCMIGWILVSQSEPHLLTLPFLVVLQVVMGAAAAGLDLASGNIALKLAPRGEATVFLAANGLLKSLCAGLAPIAGGFLAEHMAGFAYSFTLRWDVGSITGEVALLHVHLWHLFFIASALLGGLALMLLARVEESGTIRLLELCGLLLHWITRERGRGLPLSPALRLAPGKPSDGGAVVFAPSTGRPITRST